MRYAQHITVGEQQNGSGTPHRWGVLFGGVGGRKRGQNPYIEALLRLLYSYWGRK